MDGSVGVVEWPILILEGREGWKDGWMESLGAATAFHLISDGYELPSDGRQKVFPNGTLTISTASKSADEGYYTCTAFNRRDESDSGNAHIQVTSKNSQERVSVFIVGLSYTVLVLRMGHRKWKETKQEPGTAGPGNMLGCCLNSFHFLWAILSTSTVHGKYTEKYTENGRYEKLPTVKWEATDADAGGRFQKD